MNLEQKLEKVFEKYIKDVEPKKKKEVCDHVICIFDDGVTIVNLNSYIREYLGITKPVNKYADEYWIKRGWVKRPPSVKQKKSSPSPFSREFWINKGYTEEEADFERNSRRPIRKEYWIKQGYTEEQAIIKAKETKDHNNNKGADSSKNRSESELKVSSKRTLDYWLLYHRGDEEKAKKSLKDFQRNFSLEKCIIKYGLEGGYKIWRDRQKRWVNTMNSKDNCDEINQSKSLSPDSYRSKGYREENLYEVYLSSSKFLTREEFIDRHRKFGYISSLLRKSSEEIFDSISEQQRIVMNVNTIEKIHDFLIDNFPGYTGNRNPYHYSDKVNYYSYMGLSNEEITHILSNNDNMLSKEEFIERNKTNPVVNYCSVEKIFDSFSITSWYSMGVYDYDDCLRFLKDNFDYNENLSKRTKIVNVNNYSSITMRVDEGLLRSSYEIEFYMLCKKHKIPLELEKKYPDSNMRCDFYINGVYIEIAPMYNTHEKYRIKMDKKKELYGCLILDTTDKSDYEEIVLGLKHIIEED